MINLNAELKEVQTAGIAGHIRPDGDCVGSCIGLYLYLKKYFPEIKTEVYLEEFPEAFRFLEGSDQVQHNCDQTKEYDVFFCLDCGDEKRLGNAVKYFNTAKKTICIDHHISNQAFAQVNYIVPDASSTSELIFNLLEETKITKEMAEALYMGIAHDTGVFKFSNTSSRTMEIAGKLMDKGIDFSTIVDDTYFIKSYIQNQIMGRAMLESIMMLDGRVIFSAIRQKDMDFYGVGTMDLDGIVQQLRNTRGVEAALFLYETAPQEYKVSMRSNGKIDVSQIACYFGGGGHVKAAGCTMQGSVYDVVNNLVKHIDKQLKQIKVTN
ncbi:MAG: bifunctional oligoribonuclease/PAP phosphatase NrnA [Lachnospiraceae bacterium]|nr:bifunctional oligoribonuclease/PAP phosphatase NrnA [Lachnospiraceae bacterium]